MYDVFNISTDDLAAVNQNYTRSFVRRAFLGVEGQFTQNWKYNIKLQFAPGADQAASTVTTLRLCQNTTTGVIAQRAACQAGEADRGPVVTAVATSGADTEVGFDDAFIQYVMGDWEITLGQNNQVSPMEDRTSSLNIPFNERSRIHQRLRLHEDRLDRRHDRRAATGRPASRCRAMTSTTRNRPTRPKRSPSKAAPPGRRSMTVARMATRSSTSASTRASATTPAAPMRQATAAAAYRYRARPQTGFGDRFVDTGSIAFAQDSFIGGEFGAQMNEFGMTAEYGVLEATPQSGTTLGQLQPDVPGRLCRLLLVAHRRLARLQRARTARAAASLPSARSVRMTASARSCSAPATTSST